MGNRLISLKGQGRWGGVTRLHTNDRGQRQFVKLENCYVSQDGQEIRQFPGYSTLVDLTEINNANGYSRYCPDAVRPVLSFGGANTPYNPPVAYDPSVSQTLYSRAKMSALFGFEQIGNDLFIIGESRFRESPIYDSSRVQLTVEAVRYAGVGLTMGVRLTGTVAANSATDATGPGLNGLKLGDIVYLEGIVASSAADQALIDADLNGKQHLVTVISSNLVDFSTIASGTYSGSTITVTGEIHKIRPNRNDSYPSTANGPYASDYDDRPDDPDALTVWRVNSDLLMTDIDFLNEYPCYPAWVANRQRDFGDNNTTSDVEGILVAGDPNSPVRGASRREQRRLPYRPNIEPATDRIILAVPQYGCMFQIPAQVPIDPALWTSPTVSSVGIETMWNGIYDKPRALGIPKARLVESFQTPFPISPGNPGSISAPFNAGGASYAGSPTLGLTGGTYRYAIAWYDAGTGEEGPASEIAEITVPAFSTADNVAYTIRLNFLHPGYHFGESLALRLNVYLSEPDGEALAFYGSYEIQDITRADSSDLSAVYGLEIATPRAPFAIIRSMDLPLFGRSTDANAGDPSSYLDPTRLAPQSAGMPRGAEACKYIRGVLFSGGSFGNAGRNGQLWRAAMSAQYNGSTDFWGPDELLIRAHSAADAAVPTTNVLGLDGTSLDGTLGIAGRSFPDAYQGIYVLESGLLPSTNNRLLIDRVLNHRVVRLNELTAPTAGLMYQHHEILRADRAIYERSRYAGTSPDSVGYGRTMQTVYYEMPQGQLQIGDPGAPNRATKAFIQLVDPNRGDDIKAIGHLGGSAIICTQKETYSYSWYRNPAGEEPQLLSNEFGCIGSNTMVEFDGGLAWLSDRGPVALGQGLQHIGSNIAENFYGDDSRYFIDKRGMMRNAWGAHDAQRGLVMWGLTTRNSTATITFEGSIYSAGISGDQLTASEDGVQSRLPCDEILIWSYRSNAWSTWRPPEGLEVLWMRPLRDGQGVTRMCFLAADGRIYALDDEWSDANGVFGLRLSFETASRADDSTTLQFTGTNTFQDGDTSYGLKKNLSLYLREGMLVEFLDDYGNVVAETTIASITTTTESTLSTIELSAAQSWTEGQTVRIGGRQRATITTTYVGSETMDTMQVQGVQMRYALSGVGHANARVKAFKSEQGVGEGDEARSVTFTSTDQWEALGFLKAGSTVPAEIERLGRRITFKRGQISGQEIAVQIELTGEAQVRIQDISLEVG